MSDSRNQFHNSMLSLNDLSSNYDDGDLESNVDDIVDSSNDLDQLYDGYNQLKIKQEEIESTITITALGRRGYSLNAYDIAKIVTYDFNNEMEILSNTCSLYSLLHICDKIVSFANNINLGQPTMSKAVVLHTLSQRYDYAAKNDVKIKCKSFIHFKFLSYWQ